MINFSKFGVTNLSSYDNVLGIDLGHGETSVALWKLNEHNVGDIPKDLRFDSDVKKKIYTALFISKDGKEYKIGDEATGLDKSLGNLYTCFKAKPTQLDNYLDNETITKKELVQMFFKKVVDTLYKYNTVDLKGKTIIFVGCPSSDEWLSENNDVKYAKILSEKIRTPEGKEIKVVIMPESRAALIKVYKEKAMAVNLKNGVILFDAGSSTLDCTYINENSSLNDDFSEPIGASYIEAKMLEKYFQGSFGRSNLKDEQNAKLDLRKAKETFYLSPLSAHTVPIQFLLNNKPKFGIEVIEQTFMNEATTISKVAYSTNTSGMVRGTWYGLCEGFFQYAKRRLGDKPLGTILLTGGASRMPFFQELCKGIFPNVELHVDIDPSYCVSRGLAWAGYTDFHCEKVFSETMSAIEKSLPFNSNSDYSHDSLQYNLAISISDKICNKVHEDVVEYELENWKNSFQNKTPKDLCESMTARFPTVISSKEVQKIIKEVFVEEFRKNQQKRIINIINEKFQVVYGRVIPESHKFIINDGFATRVANQLKSLEISFTTDYSVEVVNKALGWLGKGFVFMDVYCDKEDRTVKANRALNEPDRKEKLIGLCNYKILDGIKYNSSYFNSIINIILDELKPQIAEAIDNLALYFARN